jgi:dihydroneopterin aldolase
MIRDLRLYAYHGVMPQERRVGGWFVVSLCVHYNILAAMQSDDVSHTLSYADLCQVVCSEMSVPSNLLEHVASRIACSVFRQWPKATAIDLTLIKENPPMQVDCDGAGVELHLINDKTHG